jgi:hypothetical protein
MRSKGCTWRRPSWWGNACGSTVRMVSPWQRIRARVQRWGSNTNTLLLGRVGRLKVGVEVRLLRLTDPCAGAPGLGWDGLAAGPGDLRRHRAAQLVHHHVLYHP